MKKRIILSGGVIDSICESCLKKESIESAAMSFCAMLSGAIGNEHPELSKKIFALVEYENYPERLQRYE